MSIYAAARNRLRAVLVHRKQSGDPRLRAWPEATATSTDGWQSVCNICGWHGTEFASGYHSEGALCPCCGSIARDRFLYWCWTHRTDYRGKDRVLETSPRLNDRYRQVMRQRVQYTASDYDESAHRAMIKLDIQNIELPDASVDAVLTPHVLEHVPDTEKSLAELYRILAPGGHLFLEIPMPQGVTAPPPADKPEYHGDNTLVYWRFGWDLREKLIAAGFETEALVTADLAERVRSGDIDSGYGGDDCDEVDLLRHADADKMTPVADSREARRYGFLPDFMFICWHGVKPA
ncbi:MAG TPA: class I SAM-dependent methyltransferase [Mycobacteriales bacterium]|nr:class I SAM-dependent methyltransferase [Mycobacteriales bacterium]